MDFTKLALQRESCRAYNSEKTVSRKDMLDILETAILAPSACNSQPWGFVLVQGESTAPIPKLLQGGGFNKFADDVSCFVILCERRAELMSGLDTDSQHYAQLDLGAVCSYMTLAAQDKGIGSCIMGYFDEPELKRLYGIEDKIRLVIAFGYPKTDEKRRKVRKSLDQVLKIGECS